MSLGNNIKLEYNVNKIIYLINFGINSHKLAYTLIILLIVCLTYEYHTYVTYVRNNDNDNKLVKGTWYSLVL